MAGAVVVVVVVVAGVDAVAVSCICCMHDTIVRSRSAESVCGCASVLKNICMERIEHISPTLN